MATKVDIKKAFDTLDWKVLVVLLQFGFAAVFVDWILAILHSAQLSILVNAKVVRFFSCTRGVRQGDPLSPLLFYLVEEVLSRALSMAWSLGKIVHMSYSHGVYLPTHILYENYVMIFCTGIKSNIWCLLSIFHDYSTVFGQVINNSKSRFYTGAITTSCAQMIAGMLGFSAGVIPFTYLDCPMFKGKPKCIYFNAISDRIKVNLATWKGTMLSIMGRVQMVKLIIHGMLVFVYSFHVYMWPKHLLNNSHGSWVRFLGRLCSCVPGHLD